MGKKLYTGASHGEEAPAGPGAAIGVTFVTYPHTQEARGKCTKRR